MTFRHSGDLGDVCYSLAPIRALDGEHSLFFVDRVKVKPNTAALTPRADLITPLIKAQEYIHKVECTERPPDIDLTLFRRYHRPENTLAYAQECEMNDQLQVLGMRVVHNPEEAWLKAPQSTETKGRIVIARSPRYNNQSFPWADVVKHYGDRLLFVGLQKEHNDFCEGYGKVEYRPIQDYLELASLIAGSELFIGNQSSPMSVAVGLGHRLIQEVCTWQPDCIYKRDNATYFYTGYLMLPDICGSGEFEAGRQTENPFKHIMRNQVPPGLWQWPGLVPTSFFKIQQEIIARNEGISMEEADERLLMHNVNRRPDFFNAGHIDIGLTVLAAMKNAGYPVETRTETK